MISEFLLHASYEEMINVSENNSCRGNEYVSMGNKNLSFLSVESCSRTGI